MRSKSKFLICQRFVLDDGIPKKLELPKTDSMGHSLMVIRHVEFHKIFFSFYSSRKKRWMLLLGNFSADNGCNGVTCNAVTVCFTILEISMVFDYILSRVIQKLFNYFLGDVITKVINYSFSNQLTNQCLFQYFFAQY